MPHQLQTVPDKTPPPYPNNLRRVREDSAMISRALLSARCAKLAEQDDTRFVKVSLPGLRALELGLSRPRRVTAATLATSLETTVETLFPGGVDDPVRNPDGNTRIEPDRLRGGRPRKIF